MKIAIISDIHSNMEAFTAFINIAKETGIEEIYSCGDIVGYGPNPEECVKLYTEHRIIGVKGNHDAAVVDESVLFGFNTYARSAIVFTKRILSKAGENFLKDLPFLIETEKFTIFHGFPSIRAPFRYILTEDDAMEAFMNVKTPISFYGHTHKPCICVLTQDNKFEVIYPEEKTKYEIKEGFKYLINVGSIGQPRDGNPKAYLPYMMTHRISLSLLDTLTTLKKFTKNNRKQPSCLSWRAAIPWVLTFSLMN